METIVYLILAIATFSGLFYVVGGIKLFVVMLLFQLGILFLILALHKLNS